jgi:iron complex outermembrane receptor protein
LSVKLGADWTKLKGNGAGATYVGNFLPGPAGYTFVPSSFDTSEGLNTAAANAYRTTALGAPGFGFLTPMNHEQFLDFTYWGVNAEIGIDTGIGKITVIPAYRRSKVKPSSTVRRSTRPITRNRSSRPALKRVSTALRG